MKTTFTYPVLLILICSVFVLFACSTSRNRSTNYQEHTPGTIALNDTLLCDDTEITNFNWLEYLYWLSREYGDSSSEYTAALPENDLWKDQLCLTDIESFYLRHPQYRDYPVFGISQAQAEKFSKWRSDRVFQYYLIKNKMLELDFDSTESNPFTIEGYFDGSFSPSYLKNDPSGVFIRDTSLYFPTYRLPNGIDRKIILDYVDSTDYIFTMIYPKKEQKWMEAQNIPVYLQIEPCGDSSELLIMPVTDANHGYPQMRKIKFLKNIRGNVAEWSSEPNLTYGGGWPHNRSYVFKHDTISCNTPNSWTGFRNVCTWSKFDFND